MARSRKDILETESMLARLTTLLRNSADDCQHRLQARDDAEQLRRIAMTLHRWHELECGVDAGGIDRDEVTGKCWWYSSHSGKRVRIVPDRGASAEKRLAALMSRYPTLGFYIQGDPRGASLYILRPGDVPEGENVYSYYSRGLAVYR